MQYPEQFELCGTMFDGWTQSEQVHFVQSLLLRMCHQQHGEIDAFLKPMLQRDFITSLPGLKHTHTSVPLSGPRLYCV